VRLALENQSTGNQIFVDVNTTTINSWETLSFDFAGLIDANVDYNKVVVFFEFIVDLPGDGSTYYYDDIELSEPLGVNENESQTVIHYPNPTNNIWNIETNNQVIDSIQVLDIQGKVVLNIYPNSSKAIINAESLTTGMYLTRINTSEGIKIIKLVKN
ncbi:MAG: T9SS type A sorting domain-containing protein, partial [Flavobacteriaceae bacterium]|nr:T9SS type A sorting domain-containing protein [Flavobacteriaceae bacterium]